MVVQKMGVSCGRFGKQKVVLIVVIHPDGFGWCKGVKLITVQRIQHVHRVIDWLINCHQKERQSYLLFGSEYPFYALNFSSITLLDSPEV